MAQAMSNCQKCGSEFTPEDKFCKKCGAFVPSAANIPGLRPVKRARFDWLPWVVGLFTAATALFFLGSMAVSLIGNKTGYFDRLNQSRAEENVSITDRDVSFKNEYTGEKVRFRYPLVTITKKTSTKKKHVDINEIERHIEKYCEGENEGKYAADYTYFISNKNFVSILVEVRPVVVGNISETPSSKYFVYNISISVGSTMYGETLIKDLKISEKDFYKLVEDTYISYFKTADLTEREQDKLLEQVSYKYLTPYVGENGHLCFAVEMEKEDGSREWAIFDTETKERLKGPLDSAFEPNT